jgi:hypothetical protein
VAGLVDVAAFAPDEGETLGGMAQKFPPTPGFGEIQPIEDGFLLLTPKGVVENFAQDLSPEERSLVLDLARTRNQHGQEDGCKDTNFVQ